MLIIRLFPLCNKQYAYSFNDWLAMAHWISFPSNCAFLRYWKLIYLLNVEKWQTGLYLDIMSLFENVLPIIAVLCQYYILLLLSTASHISSTFNQWLCKDYSCPAHSVLRISTWCGIRIFLIVAHLFTYPLAGLTAMAYGSPAMSVIRRVQFGPLSWPTFMEYRNLVQWAV